MRCSDAHQATLTSHDHTNTSNTQLNETATAMTSTAAAEFGSVITRRTLSLTFAATRAHQTSLRYKQACERSPNGVGRVFAYYARSTRHFHRRWVLLLDFR